MEQAVADRKELTNDMEEAIRVAMEGQQSMLWTALPGIVVAVNFATMTLSVQPAIQGTVIDEYGVKQSVNLPLLINVPIVFPSAGGFALTMPIRADDEVLVIFASRCIDAWWQSSGVQRPMEARMHDLSDGFAIPGIFSKPTVLGSISTNSAQLRNNDGSAYIEIKNDASIKIKGNLLVDGNIVADEVTAAGVDLSTHVHSGVTAGGGTSGPPVP